MYGGLVHAHSGLRWVVLILLLAAIFNAFRKWRGKREHTESDRKLTLYALIATHIQLVLGLVLYFFVSPKVLFAAETMKDKIYRFFTVEHIFIMLIAITLITMGYSKAKRATTAIRKFKITFWYYLIALVLILASIPWPFMGYGTRWF